MVSEPQEWPAFASYLEDIKILQENFLSLCTNNTEFEDG